VNPRKRPAKSDRLDATKLVSMLIRWCMMPHAPRWPTWHGATRRQRMASL
jgi:hypothetical protein